MVILKLKGSPIIYLEWVKLDISNLVCTMTLTSKFTGADMNDRLLPKGMRSGLRDLFKFWEITDDNIKIYT